MVETERRRACLLVACLLLVSYISGERGGVICTPPPPAPAPAHDRTSSPVSCWVVGAVPLTQTLKARPETGAPVNSPTHKVSPPPPPGPTCTSQRGADNLHEHVHEREREHEPPLPISCSLLFTRGSGWAPSTKMARPLCTGPPAVSPCPASTCC